MMILDCLGCGRADTEIADEIGQRTTDEPPMLLQIGNLFTHINDFFAG